MSSRWRVWLSLLCVALGLSLFGDRTPSGVSAHAVVEPSSRLPERRASSAAAPATTPGPKLMALVPRESLWADAEANEPINDLFPVAITAPAAVAELTILPVSGPEPATAPAPPPPLPYAYVGKRFDGKAWEVFLTRDGQTLIVQEGMDLDSRYRVDSIKPPVLMLTYLPLSQQQSIAIGGAD